VVPFLENVLRGRSVPRARLLEVARHYEKFGGVSPLNEQNRRLIAALKKELHDFGLPLPIYFGNRNWRPFLSEAVRQMKEDGVEKALAFVTSAYSSYSGCRQYREDIERARREVGPGAPQIDKLRVFFNHPGFVEPNIEAVESAYLRIPIERRESAPLLFCAHSLPVAMADGCRYERQLRETCKLVAGRADRGNWTLVFQSRSGSPEQPWLEPDIVDVLKELGSAGTTHAVVSPIGFTSDHMEILFDLDDEAAETAARCGIRLIRAATAGTHPRFVRMIRQLIEERLDPSSPRLAVGSMGPAPDACAPNCCPRS
ncbi:MAG TPA: ferrochelatase, partial [Acidobacteriota bacterium]|nr:ferrochelatase [Acidobacteriota bacterium]